MSSAVSPFVPFIPFVRLILQDLIGLPPCRVNITMGTKEDRNLITGLHTVADVYCSSCQTILGWKYVTALPTLHAHSFVDWIAVCIRAQATDKTVFAECACPYCA